MKEGQDEKNNRKRKKCINKNRKTNRNIEKNNIKIQNRNKIEIIESND